MDKSNILIPIMSEADPAPKGLLQEVSCGCQGPCKSKRCNCRKAGLRCLQSIPRKIVQQLKKMDCYRTL
ncbi:unnamed protein product [Acanthoscelides obtectus]|uniref:Uncharacterized protein n=1 Tax=Acanthoscelides obtectus TaxID=200917 RepID=A0A9P0Q6M5_ACAOB|nr:unnamed protein product [Acanthoscelides obtectus]CAK1682916.1 hypothetical protein AOBTE_LOCUS33987 [Acanthoscelides obtectus]